MNPYKTNVSQDESNMEGWS